MKKKFNFKKFINKTEWVFSQTIEVPKHMVIEKISGPRRVFYTTSKHSHGKIVLDVPGSIGFYDKKTHTIAVHKKVKTNVWLSRCFWGTRMP